MGKQNRTKKKKFPKLILLLGKCKSNYLDNNNLLLGQFRELACNESFCVPKKF